MIILRSRAGYQTLKKAGLAGMEGKGCFNFVLILICYRSCQSKETLYIGGLFGLDTARGGWSSAGIIPAVQMAIDDINNSSECLKDYHLELLIKDSQVRMNLLVKKIVNFRDFHGLILRILIYFLCLFLFVLRFFFFSLFSCPAFLCSAGSSIQETNISGRNS